MTVGIVGLGLIGGSMAKAYHEAHWKVLAADRDESILGIAMVSEVVDKPLIVENVSDCDVILIALYPRAAVAWLRANAALISGTCIVVDCCGIKTEVCRECFPIAAQYGFTFIGGHPMAGTQYSGYLHSRATLFHGASMILVPPTHDNPALLEETEKRLEPAGFCRYTVTTAAEHDRMIAFTSQLAHIVSNAYIKSPTAGSHKGFSAGSYKDLTRVAWLNETMWSELFLENREPLLGELDGLIASLSEYRDALDRGDETELCRLLRDGRIRKEAVDGK